MNQAIPSLSAFYAVQILAIVMLVLGFLWKIIFAPNLVTFRNHTSGKVTKRVQKIPWFLQIICAIAMIFMAYTMLFTTIDQLGVLAYLIGLLAVFVGIVIAILFEHFVPQRRIEG